MAKRRKDTRVAAGELDSASPARTRRWMGLLALAVAVALAVVGATTFVAAISARASHRIVAEMAGGASPEVAALLYEANDVVDRVLDQYPGTPQSLDLAALLHSRFGSADEAATLWHRCIELDPNFTDAYSAMGDAARAAGDHRTALKYYRAAVSIEPGASSIMAYLAESLLRLGEVDEAIDVLEKELTIHPASVASVMLLAEARNRRGEIPQARQQFERAIQLAPGLANAYYGAGTACTKLGDHQAARRHFEEFRRLKARDEQAHRDRLKAWQIDSNVRNGVARIYTAAAKIHIAHGDVDTGERCLRRASEITPEDIECHEVLAWLYDRQGRTAEAVSVLARLNQTAMEDPAVCLRLGELYTKLREFEKAEGAFLKLVETAPHQGGGYAALTRLYFQTDRKIPEAVELARKAVELEPIAPYYFMLALVCQKAGDRQDSLAAIQEALARDPVNTEYQRLHATLAVHDVAPARPAPR